MASVSCITSAVNVSPSRVATVRQQPLTAIESPSPASPVTSGPRTVSRIASPWSSRDSTVPSSSTMPVNISGSPSGVMVSRTFASAAVPTVVTSAIRSRNVSSIVLIPRSPTALVPAPSSAGATYATTSSTSPSRTNAAARSGPPSRKTCCRSSWCSRSSASRGSWVSRRIVSARSLKMRRPGSRSRRPITARSGWWASGSSYSSRTVSSGSSTSTVPVPTSITSHWARNRWASTRAACDVTQRLLPSAAALRPSRVAANFQVTNGRWCSMPKVQARFNARASRSIRPNATSTPASRNVVSPPAAIGLGSGWANTTRATPASTMAWAHGPVRPVWLQGSSVTTAVAPRASAPASARAAASACGLPRRGGTPPRSRPRRRPAGRSRPAGSGPAGRPACARARARDASPAARFR